MGQYVNPLQPHYYTAEEVRARLEMAKKDGEAFRSSGGPHAMGHSGFSGHAGNSGVSGFSGIPGHRDLMRELMFDESSYETRVSQWKGAHSAIKPSRFSIRAFIRAGIADLKAFFNPVKKEIKHG